MPIVEPFVLSLPHGPRFALVHKPEGEISDRRSMLFIHPFAEELNKTRRMVALQARALAHAGWIVLQIDLYGCGDSAGEFGEATWQQWLIDVREAAAWLRRTTGRVPVLWGLRLGCLLAAEYARSSGSPHDLLFWQPTTSGSQVLQDFLRLKLMRQLFEEHSGSRTNIEQMRLELKSGVGFEIAGYVLSAELAAGLESAAMNITPINGRIIWLEVTREADVLPPETARFVQSLREQGHSVSARAVVGPRFWETQEIAECEALVDTTLDLLQSWGG